MSYRARRNPGLGTAGGVTVGRFASTDPILARSSLDASSVLLAVARAPEAQRSTVLRQKLDALQPGLAPEVSRRFQQNTRNRNQDQALFDAIRTTLADRVLDRVAQQIRNAVGNRVGWDVLVDTPLGLGTMSANDRNIGCTVTGTVATAGGITALIPVVGGFTAPILGFGSQIASGAMDCTREQREASARLAAGQAAEAQRQLDAAAASEQSAIAARRKLLVYGGGILGTAALLWLIL